MVTKVINQKLLKPAIDIKRNLPVNFNAEDSPFYANELIYKTYDCYLKFIGPARISSDSVVYKKGLLVAETLYSNELKSYYQSRYLLKKLITSKKIKLDKTQKYLLATDNYSAGHFHWMTEALPRIFCVKEIAHDFVLLLPDTSYIRNIAVESLKLLDINFQDVVLMKEDEFYTVENLYFVSKLSRTGQMNDEVMKEINKGFIGNRKPGNRKIYVSREKARCRKILNEAELIRALKAHGFDVLYGEDLSLAEQIDVFSSCKTLLGIHGAGLINCLFMHPQSNLVELRKNEINVGYWFLADSLNQNYYYYNGIPDSEKSIIGTGCNLTIPISDFEEKFLPNL